MLCGVDSGCARVWEGSLAMVGRVLRVLFLRKPEGQRRLLHLYLFLSLGFAVPHVREPGGVILGRGSTLQVQS